MFFITQEDIAQFAESNNCQIVNHMTAGAANNQDLNAFNINSLTEAEVNQILNGDSCSTRLPLDLGTSFKIEDIKANRSLTHFVKYKIRNGTHKKVWECGICKY